ncbi:MAG TPA: hypothetical protein VKE69_03440 [Planctomycetota bacterium]|nr:hypothetical protein [Planctomycetota bacterium]
MTTTWKIGRRSPGCAGCSRAFDDGERVFSSIAIGEARIDRLDRCASCHRARERAPEEVHWRTRHHASRKRARVDVAGLVEVFRALLPSGETADEKTRDLRYLVALLLLRHRKLRLVATRTRGERDYLVVAFSRSKEEHDVLVSDLPKERADALREELLALFEGRVAATSD